MRLRTQIWDSDKERYVEDELDLCDCLPTAVRLGLWDTSQRLSERPEASDDPDVARSA